MLPAGNGCSGTAQSFFKEFGSTDGYEYVVGDDNRYTRVIARIQVFDSFVEDTPNFLLKVYVNEVDFRSVPVAQETDDHVAIGIESPNSKKMEVTSRKTYGLVCPDHSIEPWKRRTVHL